MSGSCAAPNDALMFKDECDAVGTCASGAATQSECGTCSDLSATKESACATVGGTWTADVWTPTGIWELSAEEVCWVATARGLTPHPRPPRPESTLRATPEA